MKEADGAVTASLAKAQLAREVNAQVREIAETLTEPNDRSDDFEFYCECGCFERLTLTLGEYDARGVVLLPGHRPAEAPS